MLSFLGILLVKGLLLALLLILINFGDLKNVWLAFWKKFRR